MPFLQLVIGHLLGDFVFQSNDLVKRKHESWKGSLEHVFLLGLITAIVLFPYWGNSWTWISIAIIMVTHFIQDNIKIQHEKRFNKDMSPKPFYVDQVIHLLILLVLGRGFMGIETIQMAEWFENIYFSNTALILILTFVLLTYTFDIAVFQFERHRHKKMIYHPDYVGMLERILAFAITYLLLILFLST